MYKCLKNNCATNAFSYWLKVFAIGSFLFNPLWQLKNLQPKAENYFSASGCTFPALGCTFPALGCTFSALGCTFPALGCSFKFFNCF